MAYHFSPTHPRDVFARLLKKGRRRARNTADDSASRNILAMYCALAEAGIQTEDAVVAFCKYLERTKHTHNPKPFSYP